MSGDISSGTRLRQETLADEVAVSKMPIREALRQLQARESWRSNHAAEPSYTARRRAT